MSADDTTLAQRSPGDVAAVQARYDSFAREEAQGRSELYAEWAQGVASDAEIAAVFARIPARHRLPPLAFAVARLLGAPLGSWPGLRAWLLAHADAFVTEASTRLLQTNEPGRCAVLLPALSAIEQPMALVELGASAGMCLFPDAYSYRYLAPGGEVAAAVGHGSPVLACEWRGAGAPPLSMPRVRWRAGVDLHPLSAASADDRAFLEALIWPGETGRAERVREALRVVADAPPPIIEADIGSARELAAALERAFEGAPRGAVRVVTTPGVTPHLPWEVRQGLTAQIAAVADTWVSIDPPERPGGQPAPVGAPFRLVRDGTTLARCEPLGAWIEWGGASAAGGADADALTVRERSVLAFEARFPAPGLAKDERIRAQLHITPARYAQLLRRLIDRPEALSFDPLLVGRLRRVRDERGGLTGFTQRDG